MCQAKTESDRHDPAQQHRNLVRLLKDDAVSGVEGKPTLKQRGDKAYWYAARRVGSKMRFFYIGEDSDETRVRIDRIKKLYAAAKQRQPEAVCSCSEAVETRRILISVQIQCMWKFNPAALPGTRSRRSCADQPVPILPPVSMRDDGPRSRQSGGD